ncbi:MAG: formylglycine-generating enzyme family protein, partial [Myxococcota bacterium]
IFRWTPPGTFQMGSPESEQGRHSDEAQHPVTLTKGFWLGETPVTQAVWSEIMGANPSKYKAPQRPVETVSWNDVQVFLARLNHAQHGLAVRLPSEAEWEYACRAGSEAATFAGELDVLSDFNAPVLDDIAWYSGNCGQALDIEGTAFSYDVKLRQYSGTQVATRTVGLKRPNDWGLMDMLGNVWEWCEDFLDDYPLRHVIDPRGPTRGQLRVHRGGSAFGRARYCRAANRGHDRPDRTVHDVGFRLAI